METEQVTEQTVRLKAENIGGIERTEVTFDPGVTILTGRNATNRTSLLQAIMGGLGSDRVSLKGDADSGHIKLQIGDTEYTQELERQADGVAMHGDPYLDDTQLADLFAFLLESNDARRTVALEADLHDIIMEPVDDDAIQSEIRQLKSRREDIDAKIQKRQSLKEKLPKLEEERVEIEAEIEEKREELEAKRTELEEQSADASEARAEETELEEKMQDLQQAKSQLDTTTFRIESQAESLESLKAERESLDEEYEELQEQEVGDLDTIESDISRLRDQKQRLEAELSKLQSVIQFNEEMLEGASQDIASALRGEDDDGTVTDQLLDTEDSIVCWTCGSEVDQDSIEETLERLRELRQSKYTEQTDIDDELADLKDKRSNIESTKSRQERVKSQLADVRSEIEQRESKLTDLEDEETELTEEIERLEDEIAELEAQDRSDILDVHREVNELELDIERLEDERDRISENIEDVEAQIEEMDDLEEQRETISEQLEELRTRIDRIEEEAVEAFNTHMETVLDILDYQNLDRIWVERAETQAREGRRKVTKTEFRLHVVRSTEDGVTYEDDFTHLSESEREVTGLVFALAGYLAHRVHEEVPFILLDSLEAIDSERIAALVDYMEEYADYLVVALLEEDAAALDGAYTRITDI
jgi:DNA repair exonuclease SbcCD ATPase subunit